MSMKKIIRIAIQTLVAFAALGCVKENAFETIAGGSIIREFIASFDGASTKTALGSGNAVLWEAGDRIDYMYSTSNGVQSMTVEDGGPAVKIWVEMEESDTWFTAVYGASTVAKGPVEGVFTVSGVVPSVQDGLFPSAHVSIAHLSGKELDSKELKFRNLTSLIKFSLTREDVATVVFTANGGESISFGANGLASISFDGSGNPKASSIGETSSEITIDVNGAGTYYISILPQTLKAGFALKCYDRAGGYLGEIKYGSPLEILRSSIVALGDISSRISKDGPVAGGGAESGIYLGITGFNQQLYTYPISILDEASKPGFDSFINNLSMKNGTLLYYSVDQALNTLQYVPLPADLSTAAIVTFTDGLDQGSMMMNVPYGDDNEYLDALNHRIMNETVNRQPITAFSIGIRGQDVSDVTKFRNNLKKLASSDSNATEVTSMTEVNAKFKEIAEQLSISSYIQTITLTIPGQSNGTRIRFTFDNVNSADKSATYIEGTFNLSARSLENVKYVGLTSTSGTTIKGVVDGIFVTFTFEGIHTENNKLIDRKFIDEWTYITSNNTWQINSEFDKTENSDIVTKRSSAVIMLVLDCSSSLAGDFATAQNNAKDFINTLYEAVGGDIGPGENPGGNDNTIYTTTPTDLSVAIWQDGTRYYLTPEQYKNANLSNATVEGLTVLSNMGNFIISPKLIQSGEVYAPCAKYYSNVLPDKNQATVISARYVDINKTLNSLEWSPFSTQRYDYYMTRTVYSGSYNYQIYLYSYTGGALAYDSYSNSTYGYIRGVISIAPEGPIIWNDERDLCLSVIENGERKFLKDAPKDTSKYDKVEGLAVVLGEHKFIIKLSNEQSGTVNVSTAMSLYGDILPDKKQAEIISMKYSDINSALIKFGGDPFSTQRYDYYMTRTVYSGSYNYQIYLYSYRGGTLANDSYSNSTYGYIRGVISFD